MKRFNTIGWSGLKNGILGVKTSIIAIGTITVATGTFNIYSSQTKEESKKVVAVNNHQPGDFSYDDLIFSSFISDIITKEYKSPAAKTENNASSTRKTLWHG